MIVICVILYLVVILIDFVPTYNQSNKKVIRIYLVLMFIAVTLSIAIELGIDVPSPATPIKNIISAVIGQ